MQHHPQGAGIGQYLFNRVHIRLGDNLEQGDASPVEVHQRGSLLIGVEMGQFAGVLFQVHAADLDIQPAGLRTHGKQAVFGQRMFVLGDLIAFGQIGIEIILARELADLVDLTIQREGNPQPKSDCLVIDHGE